MKPTSVAPQGEKLDVPRNGCKSDLQSFRDVKEYSLLSCTFDSICKEKMMKNQNQEVASKNEPFLEIEQVK